MQDGTTSEKPRGELGLAIADFYGEASEGSAFSAERFRAALAEELAPARAVAIEPAAGGGRGLRAPLAVLGLSLLLAAASLSLALHSSRIEEEKLQLSPSALYGTESLLIETLKRRSDLDISQRDSMIAEYQTRSRMRAAYVQALNQADGRRASSAAARGGRSAQGAAQGAVSDADSGQTATDASIEGPGPGAAPQDAAPALQALARTAELAALAPENARPTRRDADEDEVIAALAKAREERLALLGRVQALEKDKDELHRKLDETVAVLAAEPEPQAEDPEGRGPREVQAIPPAVAFLGTVSVAEGRRLVVDIAHSAGPEEGAKVLLFRPSGEGRGIVLATAVVKSVRGSLAEIELAASISDDKKPQPLDAAYLVDGQQ